jgi:hypothetical protein
MHKKPLQGQEHVLDYTLNKGGGRVHSEDLYYSIAKQQTDLTKLLMEQQMKASLPQRIIPNFNGNPIEYSSFIRAFEYGIEEKTTSAKERLYYLEQYTSGEANS